NVSGIESDPNLANNMATAITVATNQPPTCSLSIAPTSGVVALTVNVTSNCSDTDGFITSAVIDWGDGTPTTQLSCDGNCIFNSTHTYSAAGSFTATVSATDNAGASSQPVTQTVVVTLPLPPSCSLTVTPNNGPAPLAVNANGTCTQGTAPIRSTTLDFGDGS